MRSAEPVEGSDAPAPTGTFAALRHRNFALLWFSLIFSNSGRWIQQVAQDFLVYELTGRAIDLGWVAVARAAALLTFSFAGGTVADRIDKRRLLLVTQTLFALIAIGLGVLVLKQVVQVWHVIVASFLGALLLSMDQPARHALVPALVPRRDLLQAVSLMSVSFTTAGMLGPAIGGLLVAQWGVAPAFFINAASYLAVIWAVAVMRLDATPRPREREPMGQAIRAGLAYVAASPTLVMVVGVLGVSSFFATPYQTLLPVFAKDVYGGDADLLGYLRAAAGMGALPGGLLLAHFAHRSNKGMLITIGSLGFIAALLGFTQMRWLAAGIGLLVLAGMLRTVVFSSCQTVMQNLSSDEMRARVMSLYTISVLGTMPLGALPMSWLADRYGVHTATGLGAGIAGVFAVYLVLRRGWDLGVQEE